MSRHRSVVSENLRNRIIELAKAACTIDQIVEHLTRETGLYIPRSTVHKTLQDHDPSGAVTGRRAWPSAGQKRDAVARAAEVVAAARAGAAQKEIAGDHNLSRSRVGQILTDADPEATTPRRTRATPGRIRDWAERVADEQAEGLTPDEAIAELTDAELTGNREALKRALARRLRQAAQLTEFHYEMGNVEGVSKLTRLQTHITTELARLIPPPPPPPPDPELDPANVEARDKLRADVVAYLADLERNRARMAQGAQA